MPTVKITAAKGLHQVTATTNEYAGSFFGDLQCVHPTVLEGVAALTASLADSGKTYILGGAGGDTVLALPAMSSSHIGYKARLVVTGALQNSIVVQTINGSDQGASANVSATEDTFLLSIATPDGAASNKVTVSNNELTFATTCATSAKACVMNITYIAANKALVEGYSDT